MYNADHSVHRTSECNGVRIIKAEMYMSSIQSSIQDTDASDASRLTHPAVLKTHGSTVRCCNSMGILKP